MIVTVDRACEAEIAPSASEGSATSRNFFARLEAASACARLLRAALVVGVLCAFWLPATRGVGGDFPAPLDDVYIYFDFARSTARGCFLCWTTDTGYSSGATSPMYALVLALGYAAGFHGQTIGWFSAFVAAASLYDATGSLCKLAGPRRLAGALGALLLLSVPLLDWSFASGMEVALLACVFGRAAVAVRRATTTAPHVRDAAQLRAGGWLALVAVGRPECVPLALCLAVAVAHGAGSRGLVASLARAAAPAAISVGALLALNGLATGEVAAAGAIRKLVTADPYASGHDVATLMVVHAVRLTTEGFEVALGGPWPLRALLLLAAASLSTRASRRLGAPFLLGSAAALLLACLNKTAPFQNLRYVAPSLILVLMAAAVGLDTLARRGRLPLALGSALAAYVVWHSAAALPRQTDHFARAAKNIHQQQVAVGQRLAELRPRPQRVFVGDAGAIPYVSDLPALDGLGLGGYHRLPFARASVHGTAAVIELIERMPASERPDVLAIYDAWWPDIGKTFGRELFRVTLDDNVICGDPTKTVYQADWSTLEDRVALARASVDRIDVGDLLDEQLHAAQFSRPHGGYVVGASKLDSSGKRRFDAMRVLTEGQRFSFSFQPKMRGKQLVRFELWTDSAPGTKLKLTRGEGSTALLEVTSPNSASWGHASASFDAVEAGERFTVGALAGALRLASIVAIAE